MNSEKAEEPKITDGAYPDTIKSENPGIDLSYALLIWKF